MAKFFTSGKKHTRTQFSFHQKGLAAELKRNSGLEYVTAERKIGQNTDGIESIPKSNRNKTTSAMQLTSASFSHKLVRLTIALLAFIGMSSGVLMAQDIDLAIRQDINNGIPELNENITYSVYLVNEGSNTATDIIVESYTPFGALGNITLSAENGTVSYDGGNGTVTWNVTSLAANDSIRLDISGDVLARGVFFNVAQVTAANENDTDSDPNDYQLFEDDIASTCFSVPILWYPGDEYTVSIPAPYNTGSGITWYKDGVDVTDPSVTGASVNPDSTLLIASPGDYTFETSVSTCPATGCCAIIIEQGPYGIIGDFVWNDFNEDGIQDICFNLSCHRMLCYNY
ncbi:hypothetical protein [Jiulongibacter sp. NS-SX5]|uniref:hypothetical protein n=1 Tax=Jiulongibacter sp. NS-SX5 TaxID=3463854 RepID=UPI0040596FAA